MPQSANKRNSNWQPSPTRPASCRPPAAAYFRKNAKYTAMSTTRSGSAALKAVCKALGLELAYAVSLTTLTFGFFASSAVPCKAPRHWYKGVVEASRKCRMAINDHANTKIARAK